MATSNPIFKKFPPDYLPSANDASEAEEGNLSGVFLRTAVVLLLFACSMAGSWLEANALQHQAKSWGAFLLALTLLSALGGAALVWITLLRNRLSPITAPAYAILQGIVMGVISAGVDIRYPRIAVRAIGLTLIICFCLLIAYRLRLIRVTESFNRKLTVALFGVIAYYATSFAVGLSWGRTALQAFGGIPGIIASVIVVIIASMSLISNIDFVVKCSKKRAPQFVEWLAAMGLLIAIIWLYLDVLDLLSRSEREADGPVMQ
jgi:uncharacterized YccA/Bax inhibitor family protein